MNDAEFIRLAIPILGVLLSLGFFFYWLSSRKKAREAEKRRNGITVNGHIMNHRVASDDYYYVRYSFKCEGKIYQQEQRISLEDFNLLRDGEIVQVSYFPGSPSTATLTNYKMPDWTRVLYLSLFILAFTLILSTIIVLIINISLGRFTF